MGKLPKVSVIVTTYNRADIVTETIDSILSQTLKDFELIVVDNVSSDNTEEVAKSYSDKRIRYFKHPNNGVIAVNRNYGIGKAQGEHIAFCDDDDLWYPGKLERQMVEFREDGDVGLVCANGINFDVRGESGEFHHPVQKDSELTFGLLVRGNLVICSSAVVKRAVLDDVGIMDESPEIVTAEDYELWLRVAKKYKVKYIALALVKYRIQPGSSSKGLLIEAIERDKMVYKKLLNKGILGPKLYQRRINQLNRRLLVVKLLTHTGTIKYIQMGFRFARRLGFTVI